MPAPSPKELKKLAAACRLAGIKTYKGEGFEFTLSEEAPPVSNYKKKQMAGAPEQPKTSQSESFESDSLSDDALMFWSSGDIQDESSTQ